MVVLKPDFNQGKPAYRLENKHKGAGTGSKRCTATTYTWAMGRRGRLNFFPSSCVCVEVFQYRLEHASKPMSSHDKTNQKRLLFEVLD